MSVLALLLLICVLISLYYIYLYRALKHQLEARLKEQKETLLKEADQQFQSQLLVKVEEQFRQWCDREIAYIRKQQMELAIL